MSRAAVAVDPIFERAFAPGYVANLRCFRRESTDIIPIAARARGKAQSVDARASMLRGFAWDEGGRELLRDTAAHMRGWREAMTVIG